MISRAVCSLFVVLTLTCSQVPAADIDTLLKKVEQAYGGAERIGAAKAYRQYGVTYSSMRGREGDVFRAYEHPDRLRVEIDYGEQRSELRILAGSHAWKQNQVAGGPFYSAMLLQAARLGMPVTLFDHRQKLRDEGTFTGRQGKTLRALELRFHGVLRLVCGIDPETGRIRESRGILDMGGMTMEFGTTYNDYRWQDGRLFAFEEGHYAMGSKTGYTRLKKVEVKSRLPGDLFKPSSDKPPLSAALMP